MSGVAPCQNCGSYDKHSADCPNNNPMTPIEQAIMNRKFEVELISGNNEHIPIDAQTIKEWLEECHTKGLRIEVRECATTTLIEQAARILSEELAPGNREAVKRWRSLNESIITRHLTTLTKPLEDRIAELSTKVASEHRLYEMTFDNQTRWMDRCSALEKELKPLEEEINRIETERKIVWQTVRNLEDENKRLREALEGLMEGQVVEQDRVVVRCGPSSEQILKAKQALTKPT